MRAKEGRAEEHAAAEEAERLAKEQRLRKAVFHAIVTLSETVDQTALLNVLNCLDQSSWMEVVEERYLGRICGFPLCSNPVEIKTAQKYRIDLKHKKVFERSAEIDKFCCQNCFLRSTALKVQLEVEPLWIRGDERKKVFDLSRKITKEQQEDNGDIEYVKEQHLITSMANLEIGNSVESDDDDGSEKENEENERDEHEEIRSLPTHEPTTHSNSEMSDKSKMKKTITDAVVEMETRMNEQQRKQLSDNEKLARIRNKYTQNKVKRPPIIIEAKPLAPNHEDKVTDSFYDDFIKIFSEWCGPETIRYLRCRGRMDMPNDEDDVVTEAERMVAQFYAGDRPIVEKAGAEDIFLPPVDSVDQARQRISVLVELLKPSWRMLEGMLGVSGCGQRAVEVISSFRLSAVNIVLDRKGYDLATAVIFRLLAWCDDSLMDFFPSSSMVSSAFASYLEHIGCDRSFYLKTLSTVMDKLK